MEVGSDVKISRLLEGAVEICKPRRPDTEGWVLRQTFLEQLDLHMAEPFNMWRIAAEASICPHFGAGEPCQGQIIGNKRSLFRASIGLII